MPARRVPFTLSGGRFEGVLEPDVRFHVDAEVLLSRGQDWSDASFDEVGPGGERRAGPSVPLLERSGDGHRGRGDFDGSCAQPLVGAGSWILGGGRRLGAWRRTPPLSVRGTGPCRWGVPVAPACPSRCHGRRRAGRHQRGRRPVVERVLHCPEDDAVPAVVGQLRPLRGRKRDRHTDRPRHGNIAVEHHQEVFRPPRGQTSGSGERADPVVLHELGTMSPSSSAGLSRSRRVARFPMSMCAKPS